MCNGVNLQKSYGVGESTGAVKKLKLNSKNITV